MSVEFLTAESLDALKSDFPSATWEQKTEAEWKANRGTRIGASDAPIVCGVSRYLSPFALYHERIGTLAADEVEGENENLYWGRELEGAIIGRFQRERAGQFSVKRMPPWTTHVSLEDPRLAATLDAVTTDLDPETSTLSWVPLEVKNISGFFADEWGDEPPIYYTVQCQHQMMVTGARVCYLAALIGGNRFRWARIQRDDEFIALMRDRELDFLALLESRTEPEVDASSHTRAILKRLYPKDAGTEVLLPPEAVAWDADRLRAKEAEKDAKEIVDLMDNRFKAALGTATVGRLSNGVVYQYRVEPKKEYTVAASETRVLRRKAAKGK